MAAASPSPALSNNSTDTSFVAAAASIGGNISVDGNSSRNQRGLNKPKCIKCGNVARSRCPYQSCKSCCAKAQNPCHIHVLKGTSSIPDKVPSSGSPSFDQQSTEVSSSGNSFRVASLRQLSNSFAQFNNLQSPLRSRKPLTKKEAVVINEWRFMKLKEYRDRNIEVENDAFDRYMQNVSLLEEVFSASSTLEEPKKHASPVSIPNPNSGQNDKTISNPDPISEQNHETIPNPDPNSEKTHETIPNSDITHETTTNPDSEQNHESIPNSDPNSENTHETIPNPYPNSEKIREAVPSPNPNPNSEQNDELIPNPDSNSEENHEMISLLKVKLRSDQERIEISRKRVRYNIDQGLKKLKKLDTPNVAYDLSEEAELLKKPKKTEYSRVERVAALRDLTEKLSMARNKEDLKVCHDIKARIFDIRKKENEGVSGDSVTVEQQDAKKEDSYKCQWPPKWFSTVTIDQDAVNRIDAHFSSLEEIEDL